MKTNVLCFDNNLEILRNREYFPDECIDLTHRGPPFNSEKDYTILFKENSGVESEPQVEAFSDTWEWGSTAQSTYHDIAANGPLKVGKIIGALHGAIGSNGTMACLVMMTATMIELHHVLKPSDPMRVETVEAAFYYSPLWEKDYPKIQIFPIGELLHSTAKRLICLHRHKPV